MQKISLFVTLVFVLLSCADSSKKITNDIFLNKYEINPIEYKVNEIIKPSDIIVLEDYLVVMNEIVPNEKCFFVYSLPSFNFLYSFADNGHGPKDYIAPELVQNPAGNSLSVFDQATFKLIKYEIHKNQESIVEERVVEIEDRRPLQEIYYHNDSIIVFSTLDNEIRTYNLNTNNIIDSFRFESSLREDMGRDYNKSFEEFHFVYKTQNVIVGFSFFNKLVKGKIDDRGNIDMTEKLITYGNIPKSSIYDNTLFYMYINLTSDFIFAQYSGYIFKELQPFPLNFGKRKFDMLLEVYTTKGEPIAVLDLQHDFVRCKIDEKNKKIYTWNILEDFDFLLVYDYSIIQ